MSILIKGMEMPTSCDACRFCGGIADTDCGPCAWCEVDGKAHDAYTRQDCPLVPVPPHGRLIDADMLKKIVASSEHMDAGIFDGKLLYSDHLCVGADYEDVCKAIDETPTIVPAEEGET